jgi:TonB-linked SusC/RagA family outer membrane protein
MKKCLATILLLTSLCSYAARQEVLDRSITIQLTQVPFAEALTQLGDQAGVKFVYTFTPDNDRMKVTLNSNHKKLRDVLQQFLQPYSLGYEVMGNKIILKKQAAITGNVTDAKTGQPLPNVSIRVKNKSTGTATNVNGHFTIAADEGTTLVATFIGYKSKEVKAQAVMNITLEEDTKSLGEVVITALGIKKERKALGYSVSEVSGESMTEARENNVMNSLEGRVAGVNVSNVATGPGGSANVIIRGVSSITGSSQPLYVVDGIPLTNTTYSNPDTDGYGGSDGGDGIGNINPDDIESMSILKGAAASALYGYRGSKGVILITTKSGKKGKGLGVDVNSNYVVERVIDNTDWQTTYGQGYGGLKPINAADAIGSGLNSFGAKLDGEPVVQFDGVSRPYSAQKGNLHRFYENGATATNTVALSKGFSDQGSARFSLSDLRQTSMIPNAGLKRQSFHLSTQYNLDKHLSLDLKANYITQQVKNTPNISDAPANLNFATMFLPPNVNIKDLAPGYTSTGDEQRFSGDEYTTNPYFAAYKFSHNVKRNRFIGMANLKYTFDNGLYLQARVGEDYFADRVIAVTPNGTAYLPEGSLTDNTYHSTELNVDGLAGKEFKLAKEFTANVTVGANYRKAETESININGGNFAIPFLYTLNNLQNFQTSYSHPTIENRSVYGTVDLAYKGLLYLNVTGRNDWYSTLAPGKITYFYPSVNGSFVFSELLHIKNMDFGKLRLGYADVGGEADDAYQTFLNYNIVTNINGYPVGNIVNDYIPNRALKPSSAKELEIGTELSFFDSRLKFDIAAYQKKITNSIIPATTSETSGYTGAYLNLGNLRNDGIEWLVTGTPVKGWTVSVNGSYNNNKVLSLSSDQDNLLLARSRAGEDDGQNAYIAQIAGKSAAQIMALDPERDEHGNVILDPSTAAPNPDNATYKPFGSGIHSWTGGITNEFTFHHFNLSFLVDGKFGGKIFSGTNYYAYQMGLSKETLPGREKLYGDGIDAPPINAQDYYTRLSIINSKFIYDASFIKLRQVIVGYTFPVTMLKNKVQALSLSIVVRNALTLMKHTPNIDPESNYTNGTGQGLELAGVPPFRSVGLNLNVKL